VANLHAKVEVSSFNRFRDMEGSQYFKSHVPFSPNSTFLYSSISLNVWSSFVTIALSVVKKYAETLSIGLSWRFS